MNSTKGSVWRLWDLHVHTPESVLSNGFGNWDEYTKILFKKAIELGVEGIGITDYYSIDGYKKLKKDYLENEEKLAELFNENEIRQIKKILIVPNIEFRISRLVVGRDRDLAWNRKVNLHLLLSNEVSIEDIETNLLNQLTFEHEGNGDGPAQVLPITKKNLTDVGNKLIEVQSEFKGKNPLWVGMVNASIDDQKLVEALMQKKNIFKGKFLIGLCADEDLSIVGWASGGHLVRKVLIQKSHLIFSSNKNTRQFLLGKKHGNVQDFKAEFGNLKPCVWGSDAHTPEKLLLPDLDNFTWIKSDLTFEGLRQVMFEPEDRVRIQKNIPEQKTPYQLIEKVRFIDNTGRSYFSNEWIEFNPNLNAIIGGKSSGKSLLLYHIAKAISKDHVKRQMEIVPNSIGYEKFIAENPFDLEVVWGNGVTNKLSDALESTSQITYIPQLFINQLAEKKGEQYLNDLVESILGQNSSYQQFKEDKVKAVIVIKLSMESHISQLFIIEGQGRDLTENIKRIGDKENVEKEIQRLEAAIAELRKESGFSEKDSEDYVKLVKAKAVAESRFDSLHETAGDVDVLRNSLKESLNGHQDSVTELFSRFNKKSSTALREVRDQAIKDYQALETRTDISLAAYATRLTELKLLAAQRVIFIDSEIAPYNAKIKNQEILKVQLKNLEEEKAKLKNINQLMLQRDQLLLKWRDAKQAILTQYEELFAIYKSIRDELNTEKYTAIGDELELSTELYFDESGFRVFQNAFDRRTRLNKHFDPTVFNDNDDFLYDESDHVNRIKSTVERLTSIQKSLLRVKEEYSREYLYKAVLGDYFKFRYSIKHKGDDIVKMSPGKRGLVLLQLILHLSNASHPILIDQPEDNLDNRTIYFQLRKFVREKKLKRQIVFVTHNANLIVSTDSENIIVANQDGQQAGKENKTFKFEYVSGALENTFVNNTLPGILYKTGIREHVCDILEGGKEAFQEREEKYGFK